MQALDVPFSEMPDWMKKRFFNIPASINPALDDRIIDSKVFSSLNEATCKPPHCNYEIAPRISGLLLLGRPAAVAGFVVSVLVRPTVNAFPVRLIAHVLQKVLKRITPSWTNYHTTTAVKMKVLVLWVLASGNHGKPCVVCSSFASSMCATAVSEQFALKAPTRLSATLQKGGIVNNLFLAALTTTKKLTTALSRWEYFIFQFRDDFKSSKCSSDERYFGRHSIVFLSALFSGGCPAATGTCCDYQTSSPWSQLNWQAFAALGRQV